MKSRTPLLSSALLAALSAAAPAGVTMAPLTTFGGGDAWRAPNEVLAGDTAGTTTNGNYSYLGTGSLDRGLAYNPATGKLVLVSRSTAGNGIRLLNAASGVDVGFVAQGTGIITGGTFAISTVGVSSGGAIYVANLTTNATSTAYKIYKWAAETDAAPTVHFNGTVTGFSSAARLGDDFDLIDTTGGPVCVAGCGNVIGYTVIDASGAATPVPSFNPIGPATGDFRLGITFAGSAGEVWGRQTSASSGRRTTYSGSAGSYLGSLTLTNAGEAAMDYTEVGGRKLLAVLDMNAGGGATNRPTVRIYDMSAPDSPALAASGTTASGTLATNTNAVGSLCWGDITGSTAKLYAMSANQGIQAFTVTVTPDITPVSIAGSPASRAVYDRGQTTFTVSATGTPPFSYQWYHGLTPVPGATSASLTLNPVIPDDAGDYVCRVSNAAPGFAESTAATLTVTSSLNTPALTSCWQLVPGSRPYLSAGGDTERGVDYDPVSNRLYLVSRNPSPQIHVLDGTTAADLGQLNLTGVSGGNFVLMFSGVGSDSRIWACNLSNTGDGGSFKIYRWSDDDPATLPVTVYNGNPIGSRIGDSFDVRGAGNNAECLAGARNTNQVVVFRMIDADNLNAYPVTITGAPSGAFALGVAFGSGNTLWGHGDGGLLYYCSYDALSGTGSVIASYGTTSGIVGTTNPFGVDPVNHCLAAIELGNSDNVRLFQFSDESIPALTLLDQEFFATDNANGNRVGSVSVGAGKVYALNTNNGLVCYSTLKPAPPVIGAITRNPGGTFSFSLTGTPGFNYVIEASPDLTVPSWLPVATIPFTSPTQTVTRPLDTSRQFFRARIGP